MRKISRILMTWLKQSLLLRLKRRRQTVMKTKRTQMTTFRRSATSEKQYLSITTKSKKKLRVITNRINPRLKQKMTVAVIWMSKMNAKKTTVYLRSSSCVARKLATASLTTRAKICSSKCLSCNFPSTVSLTCSTTVTRCTICPLSFRKEKLVQQK